MSALSQAAVTRTVFTDHGEICYDLTRKRVKNLNLRVERDGAVRVSAPARVSLAYIDAFVAGRAAFIHAAQARFAEEQARLAAMPEVDDGLCRERVQTVLERLFPLIAPYYNGPFPKLKLRTMKSRWGSCAWGTATVTLNRRLWFAPPECLEYVALHELCHLVVHDHSPRFHDLMTRLMPDWKARKRKLAQQG